MECNMPERASKSPAGDAGAVISEISKHSIRRESCREGSLTANISPNPPHQGHLAGTSSTLLSLTSYMIVPWS